jgi:LuxR family maltose regulon positive regulatory protein
LGRHAEARSAYNASIAQIGQADNSESAFICRSMFGLIAFYEGKVLEAERYYSGILVQAEEHHRRRSISASTIAAVLAEVLYELDRIDDARETLANRLNVLHYSAPQCMYSAAQTYARLQALQESPQDALDFLVVKETRFRDLGLCHGVAIMLAEQVALVLATGDFRHADSLQGSLDELARQPRASRYLEDVIQAIAALSRARLALARRDPQLALSALDAVQDIASAMNRGALLVCADILKAIALAELKRAEKWRSSLKSAVASGYRLGLMRTFLDEGESLRVLLEELNCDDVAALAHYKGQLLARFAPAVRQAPSKRAQAVPSHEDTQPLTNREQEILALLEQSMSNKRIALALNISVQTVKWNLKNIFIKLGVSSRYEAMLIARKRAGQG